MKFEKLNPYMSRGFEIHTMVTEFGHTEADAKRIVLMGELKHVVARRKCKKEGHKWVDQSRGGPESGGAGGCCVRCGFYQWVQLY